MSDKESLESRLAAISQAQEKNRSLTEKAIMSTRLAQWDTTKHPMPTEPKERRLRFSETTFAEWQKIVCSFCFAPVHRHSQRAVCISRTDNEQAGQFILCGACATEIGITIGAIQREVPATTYAALETAMGVLRRELHQERERHDDATLKLGKVMLENERLKRQARTR